MTAEEEPPRPPAAARFPLRDFDELAAALGDGATLNIKGRELAVPDARELVPRYYFPVGSPADLAAKLADLAAPGFVDEHDAYEQWRARTAGGADADAPPDGWS